MSAHLDASERDTGQTEIGQAQRRARAGRIGVTELLGARACAFVGGGLAGMSARVRWSRLLRCGMAEPWIGARGDPE